ncbi:MAG: phosphatase PAP2 family protein [Flavobacterium sp.]|nr:phosphatase PAP2 family protein [Flavobacterium sp.]
MKEFIDIIKQNRFFYSLNLVLIVLIAFVLSLSKRVDGFIWLNQFHTKFLNFIFEGITFLGDGWFCILIALYLAIFSKRHKKLALIIVVAYLNSGIFSQLIKNIIVAPRPKVYFEMHHLKYYLDTFATSRIGFNSFPSGHTASFFALVTVLSNYCKKRQLCFFLILLSIVVGYTRIYLGHHFLIDVFFGAIIGIVFGTFSIIWVEKTKKIPIVKYRLNVFKKRKSYRNPNFSH